MEKLDNLQGLVGRQLMAAFTGGTSEAIAACRRRRAFGLCCHTRSLGNNQEEFDCGNWLSGEKHSMVCKDHEDAYAEGHIY